jgi:chromosomal replication initiation ATPase DnaA
MRPTFEEILQTVSAWSGVNQHWVLGSTRAPRVVQARALVCYLAHELGGMSYPEISAALGRRTHSTALTAAKRVEAKLLALKHEESLRK